MCWIIWGWIISKQSDIKKKQVQLAKQLKLVCNETGKPREKDVVGVVRSAVRRAWMRSPTKLSLLMKNAVHVEDVPEHLRPPKLTKNTKWLYKCDIENTYHILSDVEVDHIKGEHSLKEYDDMVRFTKSILDVGWSELRVLSKEAHAVVTYAERYNMTYEDAKKEKEVIAIMNSGVVKQKAFIKKHKIAPASTIDKRRDQIRDIIRGNKNDTT